MATYKIKKAVTYADSEGDILVEQQFKRAMKEYNDKRIKLNAPIAKYDIKTGRAYLEYPDGRIEYGKKA